MLFAAKFILINLCTHVASSLPIPVPLLDNSVDFAPELSLNKELVQSQQKNVMTANEVEYLPKIGQTSMENENKEPSCHMEERVIFEDRCEPYIETICYTQNKEVCEEKMVKNCTGIVETQVERVCFNVTKLLCSHMEDIHYQTLRENYQVQRCFTTKDRICDTVYAMDITNQDDYQCIEVVTPNCYMEEEVLADVTCTDTVEFDCKKLKPNEAEESLNWATGRMDCSRTPKQECYEVPRMINTERCDMNTHKYCEKFTNLIPVPYQEQNCHFEPKKICEIQGRSRIKKGKKYTYRKYCEEVPREICDQVAKKVIKPVCSMERRIECSYEPEEHCEEEIKQNCFLDERVVLEEVCSDKLDTTYLLLNIRDQALLK